MTQLWQTTLPGAGAIAQPSGGDGYVFVAYNQAGSYYNHMLAGLDALHGGIQWSTPFTNMNSVTPPAYQAGRVYIQTLDNNEQGLVTSFFADGSFGWRQPFQSQWASWPAPTVDSGSLYIAGGVYSGMYGFGALDGSHEWFCDNLPFYDGWTPSLDANYAYTYVGDNLNSSYGAGLYAVNRATGVADYQIWDPGNDWSGYTEPGALCISGNLAFITNGGRLVAFDIKRRLFAWQVTRSCTGQPCAVGNLVCCPDGAGITAFDASTGNVLWTWSPPSGSLQAPFLLTNTLLVASTSTGTFAVDLATRQVVWSTPLSGTLSIADGNLYIGGSTGTLTAISLSGLQLVVPTSLQLTRGSVLSGGLWNLDYFDQSSISLKPGFTLSPAEAPLQVLVSSTSKSTAPNTLKLRVVGHASEGNIGETVALYNFATNQWDSFPTVKLTTVDAANYVTAANPSNYVSSATGQMQARLSFKQVGPTVSAAWTVSIDQAAWLEN